MVGITRSKVSFLIFSDIFSDRSSDILSGISSDILFRISSIIPFNIYFDISPSARWRLLDFMSVAAHPPFFLLLLLAFCRTSTTTIHASIRCRTSTTTIHAQYSLPDLNHDHPRPVFAAGPQPRSSTPSVRCRTSTTTIHAQSYAKSYAR